MPQGEYRTKIAPPTRGAPTLPSMMGGQERGASTADLIRQATEGAPRGMESGGMMGRGEGGGGGAAQAAQLIAGGAQQLIQAAQMFPALAEPIQQAIAILQQGVQQISGGGGGGIPSEMGGGSTSGRGRGSFPKARREKPTPAEDIGMEGIG